MINFDNVIKENIKEHNPNWPQIPDHPYRILITGDSGSGKINSLFSLINQQPNIGYLVLLFICWRSIQSNKRESTGSKHLNDSETFIEYSNDMDDTYKNIEEYNPNKKRKILIGFDDMTADMINNTNRNKIVTELFIRWRKLNISLVLITQSYFAVQKNIRLISRDYFIMKIPNKRELHQIAYDYSSDIDFKDLMNLYKNVLQNHIIF